MCTVDKLNLVFVRSIISASQDQPYSYADLF
jgi:hypothetical protein